MLLVTRTDGTGPPRPATATDPATAAAHGAVAVAGGHPLVAAGVAAALSGWMRPVPLAQLARAAPAGRVVVVDLTCGRCASPAAGVRLLGEHHRLVLLVALARMGAALELLDGGGVHAVGSWEPTDALRAVVRAAALGRAGGVVTDEVARAGSRVRALRDALTRQEREALRLYACDLPAKSVARRMAVSETTTKEYLRRVRVKLAERGEVATSKLELRRVAEQLGLVEADVPCRPS